MRKNLEQMVSELETLNASKKDYVVDSATGIGMIDGMLHFYDGVDGAYQPTKVFHENICSKLNIPRQYYDRMREQTPKLLDASVNEWLPIYGANALVRTYDLQGGKVARAFLSDSYKAIDNYDVLFAALDAMQKFAKKKGVRLEFEDCELTERRMYVRVTCPDISAKADDLLKQYKNPNTGETGNPYIITGLQLSNSEVGCGAFNLMSRAKILVCNNGLTRKNDSFRKVHLGAKLEAGESEVKWSNQTHKRNLDLIVSQVGDAVQEFLSKDYLVRTINYYTNKGLAPLVNPVSCVNNVTTHLGYSQERKQNVLDYFIKSTDNTRFGVMQALTFDAHEQEDGDAMYEAELSASDVFDSMASFDKPSLN